MTIVRPARDHRVVTPLLEPPDNVPDCWEQQNLVCALTHSGGGDVAGGGHWVAFRKIGDMWWNLDTQTNVIVHQNPFQQQHRHTVELLVFRE